MKGRRRSRECPQWSLADMQDADRGIIREVSAQLAWTNLMPHDSANVRDGYCSPPPRRSSLAAFAADGGSHANANSTTALRVPEKDMGTRLARITQRSCDGFAMKLTDGRVMTGNTNSDQSIKRVRMRIACVTCQQMTLQVMPFADFCDEYSSGRHGLFERVRCYRAGQGVGVYV
jgi:hypothetical protein